MVINYVSFTICFCFIIQYFTSYSNIKIIYITKYVCYRVSNVIKFFNNLTTTYLELKKYVYILSFNKVSLIF